MLVYPAIAEVCVHVYVPLIEHVHSNKNSVLLAHNAFPFHAAP